MNIQLISAILRGKWMLDQAAVNQLAPMVQGILNGYEVEVDGVDNSDEVKNQETTIHKSSQSGVSYFTARTYTDYESMPYGSVAVIRISGPLMKNSQWCGPVGMADVGAIIKRADGAKNVAAIVLHIDSPGGTVDGTKDLVDVIRSTEKPIIAFADGLMASAALWIGSATAETYASQDLTEIGSIGVVLSFADVQPMWEKEGVKFHTILAPQSNDKNKLFDDIRNGKYEEFQNDVLAPIADEFIRSVKESRPNTDDKRFTGKVYFAKDVVGELIEGVQSFDETIIRAKELAEKQDSNSNLNNNTAMKNYPNITGALGTLESKDGSITLNAEQLEKLETAMANAAANAVKGLIPGGSISGALGMDGEPTAEEITAKVVSVVTVGTQTTKDLTASKKEVEELTAENVELKSESGATTAKVVIENDAAEGIQDKKEAGVIKEGATFMENVNEMNEQFPR